MINMLLHFVHICELLWLHEQGVCNPVLLLDESSGVVQMEYSHQVLLVSTQHRSLLYCTQKQEVKQLGTKPWKRLIYLCFLYLHTDTHISTCINSFSFVHVASTGQMNTLPVCVCYSSGRFGACFLPALCKQSDVQMFAARPGVRLWRCDITGQVEETCQLRPLFNTQVKLHHMSTYRMYTVCFWPVCLFACVTGPSIWLIS